MIHRCSVDGDIHPCIWFICNIPSDNKYSMILGDCDTVIDLIHVGGNGDWPALTGRSGESTVGVMV